MKKNENLKKAFFLDRDGTINIDRVYINDPVLIDLIPGAAKAIRKARDAGFLIVVVTNQSGVGRGIIPPAVLPKIHAKLDALLAQEADTKIDLYKICMHSPSENCACRKPNPNLVNEAVSEFGIDLSRSVFVGDKLSDVACGKNSGCKLSLLVRSGKGEQEEVLTRIGQKISPNEIPDRVCDDLLEAVEWSLKNIPG